MKLTTSSKFCEFVMFDRPKELGIPPMLCQGDSGGHNLFFKKASDGTVSNEVCAFLDWQIAFKGNPFYDIARLAGSFADAEVRREVEADLVEHYYEHLKKGVEKRGGKKLDFGLEQASAQTILKRIPHLREAYELSKAQSAMMTVGWIPFVPIILKDKVPANVLDALREKRWCAASWRLWTVLNRLRNTHRSCSWNNQMSVLTSCTFTHKEQYPLFPIHLLKIFTSQR